MALAAGIVYAVQFRSTDGDPADRGVTWVLSPVTWCLGVVLLGSVASQFLPDRLHHTPIRWISASLALGAVPVVVYLGGVFGPYLLLAASK